MARRLVTFSREHGRYTFQAEADENVVGVQLKRDMPASVSDSGTAGATRYTESDQRVKVRPTNVTATISSLGHSNVAASLTDPDYILLHNGPSGGFSQGIALKEDDYYQVNAVVQYVITDTTEA